jgi:sugar lactone lactonase YvrE
VIRIDPETGKLLLTIKMPAYNITSVAFGGTDLDELYVTSASFAVSEDKKSQYPESGYTFKITGLNVKGLPMDKFQL